MSGEPDIDALAAVVYQAFSLISRRAKQMQTSGELTLPERVALARLDRGGPSSAADMSRVEQISPQAMRVTLGSLESQGLVQRELDPTDGRRQVMSLTPAGVEHVRHDRDARARRFATVLAEEFSTAELRTLTQAAPLIERLGARF
ncbi:MULTISPECIES: MarR family winged helix-turn-helix transcriptional regulator [unclassified Mycobacterium]|uniref:MarR family winged helix-turn-helix transcriptional regulator n=1 Tax=unclassified Mycobacterium TaxID=2642494 RepID=UPI0029C8CC91|nr:MULTISPECIES: MarR family transcriptional regulator [unclassified Mycobacterium]